MFLFSLKRYCPECYCGDIRKSRRRGIMEKCFLPFLLFRPYRCQNCRYRYLGLSFAGQILEEKKDRQQPGRAPREAT